jgi:hypothetical protein
MGVGARFTGFRRWAKGLMTMVTVHRRVEITVESDGVMIVRRGRSRRGWCGQCGREVEALQLSPSGAPATGSRAVLRRSAESQGWHVFEDTDGSLMVCLNSVESNEGIGGGAL